MKPAIMKVTLLLMTFAVCFAIGEVTVRVMGSTDISGNFMFKNRVIRPHNLPVDEVADSVRELQSSDASVIIYDQYLGWAPRPDAVSQNGLYRFNSQGLRSPVESFAARADSGVLRIALFGDSFTHGDDVAYEHSFGAVLEAGLNMAGIRAEVLNFGVGGYGIDQAMLRYTAFGKNFNPDLVVFGFQPENLKRNLNLLRPLYDPRTSLPFAKPRFIFEGDGIQLINVPVLPPEEVAGTLGDLANWNLLPHEYFYDPADYRGAWWQHSRLLATLAELKRSGADPWLLKRTGYRDNGASQKLGWGIIQAFAGEVHAAPADFLIVHLPTPVEMYIRHATGRWPYQTFLDALDKEYEVVHPENRMIEEIDRDGISAVFDGHYNARGNRIIAESLQSAIGAHLSRENR